MLFRYKKIVLCHWSLFTRLRLRSIDFCAWGWFRLCWYMNIILYHMSFFRSINLWVWGLTRQCKNMNIILSQWNYFMRSYRHIIIALRNLKNFRYSFKFICRIKWRHWFDQNRFWLYLYLLLIRISFIFVFDCLK